MIAQPMSERDQLELCELFPEDEEFIMGIRLLTPHIYAARHEGHLLGAGGVYQEWPGVGRCWLILTPYAQQVRPRATVMVIRNTLTEIVDQHGFWRLEGHTRVSDPPACKLLRVLGWRREGRCLKYMPDGSDAYLYAWVKDRPARKWTPRAKRLHDGAGVA